jgi:hypothetical protein
MFDWQKDLIELWESLVRELPLAVAQFVDEVGTGIAEVVEELAEAVTEEIEFISTELKELPPNWQGYDWLAGFIEEQPIDDESTMGDRLLDDEEDQFSSLPSSDEEWPVYYEPKRAATLDHQPACIGCRNYNGTTFGGHLLVCGFHPYGCQEETCPDWEAE